MSLSEDLGRGTHGVSLDVPREWPVELDGPRALRVLDQARRLRWHFLYFPGIFLDFPPDHEASLRRDVEHHARHLFGADGASLPASPVLRCERVEAAGAAALAIEHQVPALAGHELVVGHLLLPLAGGLFEARSVGAPGRSRQAVEEGQRWLLEGAALAVTAPGKYEANVEVTVPGRLCSFVPPPRFVPTTAEDEATGMFLRVSLSGADGLDRFFVERLDERLLFPFGLRARLARRADELTRQRLAEAGLSNLRCAVTPTDDPHGRPGALALVEGDGHAGRLRGAIRWLLEDNGQLWCLNLLSTTAQPHPLLADELAAVVQSWRWRPV